MIGWSHHGQQPTWSACRVIGDFMFPLGRRSAAAGHPLSGTALRHRLVEPVNSSFLQTVRLGLKSLLLHNQTLLPVTGGRLDLGPWQEVFYAEFDGKRRKRLIIKVLGE